MRKYLVSGKYNGESEYRTCGLVFALTRQDAISNFLLKNRWIFYSNFKAREIL